MPPLPQRMGAPYLGQQYVAAALIDAGHEVRCVDLSAAESDGCDELALAAAADFRPHLIGMTLFTVNALHGYRLAEALRTSGALLVAGGPHATVLPEEPLAHGFDVVVSGEGEHAILAIADWHAGHRSLDGVPGITRAAPGHLHGGACSVPRQAIDDLDALPFPGLSHASYDATAYGTHNAVPVTGGMMTSRGCPARCTFCANYVTGRVYRWRSAANVVGEMRQLQAQHGVTHFSFWDDAFTAQRRRLNDLCDALAREPALTGTTWSCITPANMVRPHDLARMREAGCVAVNFGIESGDPAVLKSIKKGQRPEQTLDAVRAARAEGMTTIVNLMFGFPGEGVAELDNTQQLMAELAPHTDLFNNRGVLIPMPGTAVYEQWHQRFGFARWWLDERYLAREPDMFAMDAREADDFLDIDPALEHDFFQYAPEVRSKIGELVRAKAAHNRETLRATNA